MKCLLVVPLLILAALGTWQAGKAILIAAPAIAADVMTIAANTGAQMGKAIHCGYDTDEFGQRAGRAIDHYATTGKERAEAIKQFATAAEMAARIGPVGESCSEFREGFEETLSILKAAGF